jgi:pimeloyl-ACP methyl ester carboxylesterase
MNRLMKALGLVTAGWAIWRLFGPDLQPTYQGVQERPIHVPGRSVFVGHREFFVREAGPADAPPLVLIHGWAFNSEMTFFRVVPALAERYRVILPDLRNHGKSDRIRGRFEIEDLADELAGILDALGISKAAFFGYSLGGLVAQTFAFRYPDRVERLMLGATAARPVARLRPATRVAFWLGRAGARFSKKEPVRFTYTFLTASRLLDPAYGRWMWASLLDRDPTLYYESGNAIWRYDAREWVGRLRAPTMIVIPTEDRVMVAAAQYELARLLPDARVVEIEGAGHESILSRPEEYVAAIEAYLDGDSDD